MNEVADQLDGIRWADGSDLDYDSDASVSNTDGSEGEVPDVNDEKATDFSNEPDSGAGGISAISRILDWTKHKPSTIATPSLKESSFSRGWKPVIDGKIQVRGEGEARRVRSPLMPSSNGTSSSQKSSSQDNASASPATTAALQSTKDGNESDSDVRRVPEMAVSKGGASSSAAAQSQSQPTMKRKRGGGSADKEHKRLKRLLRNRVSAQQARERKKAYLGDLEVKAKEQISRIQELEEKVNTLSHENSVLRQLLKTLGQTKKEGGQHDL